MLLLSCGLIVAGHSWVHCQQVAGALPGRGGAADGKRSFVLYCSYNTVTIVPHTGVASAEDIDMAMKLGTGVCRRFEVE